MFLRRDIKSSFKVTLILFGVLTFGIMARMGGGGSRFFSDPVRLALMLSIAFLVAAAVIFIGRSLLWLFFAWGEARKQNVPFTEFVNRPSFDENLYAEFLAT
jgi:hypothetical protein